MSFKASVSLRIFCLIHLSTDISQVLKSPIIIVLLPIFRSFNICFIYLSAPVLGAFMFMNVISSSCIGPFIII